MHARLQPFCISRVCGAPFPMPAAMFFDAALPHPGCCSRASVRRGQRRNVAVAAKMA